MYLHKNGQKDYIKELKKQRKLEIEAIKNSDQSKEEKAAWIAKLILKFAKLIKGTDRSLFVKE